MAATRKAKKKATPKKKKATAKKAVAPKKAAPKKAAPKKAAPKKAAPKKAAPKKKAVAAPAPAPAVAPPAVVPVAPPPAAPAKPKRAPRITVVTAPAPATPSVDLALRQQRLTHIQSKSIADLKALLRTNDQVTTGTKTELVARVLDRVENGNLPRCPKCFIGRLRVTAEGFNCPGGYDDDEYMACDFTATAAEVTRPEWQFGTAGLA